MATNDKYDRQLRLWGANGQRALMNSHILLINADAVGSETLKNLVLPGIGQFTILDDKFVCEEDLGSNFFVTNDFLGKSRAEAVTSLLCEMNPDVSGTFLVATHDIACDVQSNFLSKFNLIIVANPTEGELLALSIACRVKGLPLMVVRSYGLIGYCRLQLSNHSIIESKPDSDPYDLRILNPFQELEDYCLSFNLSEMESLEHGHTPYIIILYQATQHWCEQHNGSLPANFAGKEAFKQTIKAMAKDYNMQLNFQEAVKESYRAFATKNLPGDVTDLIEEQKGATLTAASTEFEFLLRSLQIFMDGPTSSSTNTTSDDVEVESLSGSMKSNSDCSGKMSVTSTGATAGNNNSTLPAAGAGTAAASGVPPLGGSIPDMTSTTNFFVGLQQVYQRKAAADRQMFQNIISNLLQEAKSSLTITEESIDIFCKNVFNLRRVTTRTIGEERDNPSLDALVSAVDDPFDDPAQTPIHWYLALRSVDRFQTKHGRWPGDVAITDDAQLESDTDAVWHELQSLVKDFAKQDPESTLHTQGLEHLSRDHAAEIVRYGGCELHTVSALVGGVAAQEAVKIVTHQYVPMNNTFVYNGVAGCAGTYEL